MKEGREYGAVRLWRHIGEEILKSMRCVTVELQDRGGDAGSGVLNHHKFTEELEMDLLGVFIGVTEDICWEIIVEKNLRRQHSRISSPLY